MESHVQVEVGAAESTTAAASVHESTSTFPPTANVSKMDAAADVLLEYFSLNEAIPSNDFEPGTFPIKKDDFSITKGRVLGKGKFGKVYQAVLTYQGYSRDVALKELDLDCDSDAASIDSKVEAEIVRERGIMQQLRHPNVVGSVTLPKVLDKPVILMELLPLGDLRTAVLKRRRKNAGDDLSLVEKLAYGLQIARGMDYLARKGVVHRDLAARNCMLAPAPEDDSVLGAFNVVKVSDFGMSRLVGEGESAADAYYVQRSDGFFPVRWMAPEALRAPPKFSSKSDVWSFGVTLWELWTNMALPYGGIPVTAIATGVALDMRLPRPADCPEDIYNLMRWCWAHDSNARPRFQEIALCLGDALARELGSDSVRVALDDNGDVTLLRVEDDAARIPEPPKFIIPTMPPFNDPKKVQRTFTDDADYVIALMPNKPNSDIDPSSNDLLCASSVAPAKNQPRRLDPRTWTRKQKIIAGVLLLLVVVAIAAGVGVAFALSGSGGNSQSAEQTQAEAVPSSVAPPNEIPLSVSSTSTPVASAMPTASPTESASPTVDDRSFVEQFNDTIPKILSEGRLPLVVAYNAGHVLAGRNSQQKGYGELPVPDAIVFCYDWCLNKMTPPCQSFDLLMAGTVCHFDQGSDLTQVKWEYLQKPDPNAANFLVQPHQ